MSKFGILATVIIVVYDEKKNDLRNLNIFGWFVTKFLNKFQTKVFVSGSLNNFHIQNP